jgi:uncharacterized membrane protein YgcG
MTANTEKTEVKDAEKWTLVQELDLSTVKAKYLTTKSWWWKWRNDVDQIETEYRQFLYLIAINPGKTLVPWSQDMDDFWHAHILDTGRYSKDCQQLFGQYIHHNLSLPNEGTGSQKAAFKETKELYREAFDKKKQAAAGSAGGDTNVVIIGCGSSFTPVFCAAPTPYYDPAPSAGMYSPPASYSPPTSYHAPSCSSGHSSCSSGSSGSSCSSGSSGGSSCGGGGGCGGGGD